MPWCTPWSPGRSRRNSRRELPAGTPLARRQARRPGGAPRGGGPAGALGRAAVSGRGGRVREGKIAEPILLTDAAVKGHPLKGKVDAYLATRSAKHEAPPAFLFGAAMVALGEAEACVAGASHPTGDTIRAALRAIGMAPGTAVVSS